MKRLYLWGWPVEHSLSEPMHRAALDHLGLRWQYRAEAVAPAELAGRLKRFRDEKAALGANVTIPHKERIRAHLHSLSPLAEAVGAVNTVVKTPEGALRGDNTDCGGFRATLDGLTGAPAGRAALVLGAGGAARAACAVLAQRGAGRLWVAARRPPGADWWRGLVPPGTGIETSILPWSRLSQTLLTADRGLILINATPVGMWPGAKESPLSPDQIDLLPAGTQVVDLIYRPRLTRLLDLARARGLETAGGEEMLVRQGALSLGLWLGETLPERAVEVMREAVRRELEGTGC